MKSLKSLFSIVLSGALSLTLVVGLTPMKAYSLNTVVAQADASEPYKSSTLIYSDANYDHKYVVHGADIYYEDGVIKPAANIEDVTVEKVQNGKIVQTITYKSDNVLNVEVDIKSNFISRIYSDGIKITSVESNVDKYKEVKEVYDYSSREGNVAVDIDRNSALNLPADYDFNLTSLTADDNLINISSYFKDKNGNEISDIYSNSQDKNMVVNSYDPNGMPSNVSNYDLRNREISDSNDRLTYYLVSIGTGNDVVAKEFTGIDLKTENGYISDFSTMKRTTYNSIIELVSNSNSGRTSLYNNTHVSGVNLVRKTALGVVKTIYSSNNEIVINLDEDGNMIGATDTNGNEIKPTDGYYVVTFEDYNGKILKTQNVFFGDSATPPTNPQRTGYTFGGWDKSYKDVTYTTTLVAQYNKIIKQANTMTVAKKNLNLKKSKKTRTYSLSNLLKVKKAKGKVTYKKLSGSSKKLSIVGNKFKVAKNASGKLKFVIQVKAVGNTYYKAKTIKKTVYVKVLW